MTNSNKKSKKLRKLLREKEVELRKEQHQQEESGMGAASLLEIPAGGAGSSVESPLSCMPSGFEDYARMRMSSHSHISTSNQNSKPSSSESAAVDPIDEEVLAVGQHLEQPQQATVAMETSGETSTFSTPSTSLESGFTRARARDQDVHSDIRNKLLSSGNHTQSRASVGTLNRSGEQGKDDFLIHRSPFKYP
jgi:hypothetical protein